MRARTREGPPAPRCGCRRAGRRRPGRGRVAARRRRGCRRPRRRRGGRRRRGRRRGRALRAGSSGRSSIARAIASSSPSRISRLPNRVSGFSRVCPPGVNVRTWPPRAWVSGVYSPLGSISSQVRPNRRLRYIQLFTKRAFAVAGAADHEHVRVVEHARRRRGPRGHRRTTRRACHGRCRRRAHQGRVRRPRGRRPGSERLRPGGGCAHPGAADASAAP